ncbi:hypothetical protein V1509DRAFT_89766 [Lipomyces kononenkoae]
MPSNATESNAATAGKDPASRTRQPGKKDAGKKKTADSSRQKKRDKTRKETYSSFIFCNSRSRSDADSTAAFFFLTANFQLFVHNKKDFVHWVFIKDVRAKANARLGNGR